MATPPEPALRPRSPNLGRGHLQTSIRRVFTAAGDRPVSSTELYDWAYPRPRQKRHRYSIWRILVQIADPIERVPPYGAWSGAPSTGHPQLPSALKFPASTPARVLFFGQTAHLLTAGAVALRAALSFDIRNLAWERLFLVG